LYSTSAASLKSGDSTVDLAFHLTIELALKMACNDLLDFMRLCISTKYVFDESMGYIVDL